MSETLFVVDAFAHIYQVFYAIRGLTGPRGEPVNAVYGFARMLEKLCREYDPDYLAVAFDGKGESVRHQQYEQYKANRSPMPEELSKQIPLIYELLEALDVPALSVQQEEADDVLAAAARKAAREGVDTVVVTTDKDAEQLIDEHTRVLHVHKDREVMLDEQKLEELKGIKPSQVVEVMALAGDSSDNIPGVPGIGPKTAVKLIREFGSLEELYEKLDQVKSDHKRQLLEEHRQDVRLARTLVDLHEDIPLELDLGECRIQQQDLARANSFYKTLGFNSLIHEQNPDPAPVAAARQNQLFAEAPAETIETAEADYRAVTDPAELRELVPRLRRQKVLSVDLETTSVRPVEARVVGVAFSWEAAQGVYVATAAPPGAACCEVREALQMLRPVLEAPQPAKVGQNLKYDMAVLSKYGIALNGLQCDSMVASYLLRPADRTHNLDDLARRHLNYQTVKIEEIIGKGKSQLRMDQVPVSRVAPYACEDADVAGRLCRKLTRRLKEEDLWELFERLERPLVPVLARMEATGVKVAPGHLRQISEEFEGELQALQQDIWREAGREFNVNSPQQLSTVLFEEMELPKPRGRKRQTGWSTARDVLAELKDDHPIAEYVLRYRELSKLKSTYADALVELINEETGKIHTSFNQTITATGRLSSSSPNLQNIPVRTELGRRIRRAFVPGAGDMSLISADYSQVELRVVAHCSGDPALRGAFEKDRDIHRFVAAQINGVPEREVTDRMRQQAKAVNFGIIYGLSPYGLSSRIEVSVEEAEQFIESYFERYPRVRQFIGETIEQARRDGYVRTLAGRRRRIHGLDASGPSRQAAERIAVNTVIQGTAADLIKLAMIEIDRGLAEVSERASMLMQIHDELVFEAPDGQIDEVVEFVRTEMTGALELEVPLKVDIAVAKNWADAK